MEKLIDHEEVGQVNEKVGRLTVLSLGNNFEFHGTNGNSFNLLQVTKEYNIDQITTRTNIKGNSLIPTEENDEHSFITLWLI